MERTGLSEVIGSWKIMAISAPRIASTWRSERVMRSCPLYQTEPAVMRPGGSGIRRSIESDVTLFPEPDSPTIASVSPRFTSKETPSTATAALSPAANSVRSPSTRSTVSAVAVVDATSVTVLSWIESLTDTVPKQVEGKHGHHDRKTWEDHHPGRPRDVVTRPGEHRAPFRRRRLRAQAEEAQGRGRQDSGGDAKGRDDDQGRNDVREQMAEQQAPVSRAGSIGRLEVGLVPF